MPGSSPRLMDFAYLDRQLMLAIQYTERARIQLELMRRAAFHISSFEGDLEEVKKDPLQLGSSSPLVSQEGGAQ